MTGSVSLDYQTLADRLGSADVTLSPAETHGTFCGLICGGSGDDAEARWLDAVFGPARPGDVLAEESRRDWLGAASRTREAIEGPGLGFSPLLPQDDRPLVDRAAALHEWTQGFLYGLGLAGISEAGLSGQAREVLHDFAEITRMDLDALEGSEEDEESLEELREFVWVAAMLVYEASARKG